MSRFVRASKVRHVYCKPPKDEKNYKGFRLSTAQGDHNYIKASDKSFAIPIAQANGSLLVLNYEMDDRRLKPGVLPTLDGHRGPVLDFDFNPFVSKLIATGGDDCVTKVWGIPPEGLTESISESLVSLTGHDKKVSCVLHHPTAEFVLATGSADKTVKIWNVNEQAEVASVEHDELLQGLAWSSNGELLASTARDQSLRLIDPRKGGAVHHIQAHEGKRTMKVVFCPNNGPGNNEVVCTVGFTRQSKRQFRLWDQRDLSKPYASQNIDQSAGALLPFYDEATKLLYLAGKGDANIRYYELVGGNPWQFYIEEFRSNTPCRGICMVPRRILDTTINEVARFMKLQKDKVTPLSFICPRKNTMFQADLYPDVYAGKPSLTAEEFFSGKTGEVQLVTMDPSKKKDGGAGGKAVVLKKKKTAAVLQRELDEANKKIEAYEELLKKHKIKF
jgi:coronin-1B/1C/6